MHTPTEAGLAVVLVLLHPHVCEILLFDTAPFHKQSQVIDGLL